MAAPAAFDLKKSTKPIEEDEAKALFDDYQDAIAEAEEDDEIDGAIDLESICDGDMRVYDKALEVDELHLSAKTPSLFIKGNLKVKGIIQQDFQGGFLVVFGDVEANDLVCGAQIFISGKLKVKGTIFGNCTNYPTLVLGKVTAKTLVSAKEHYFCFYGGRAIKRIVDGYGDTPNLDDRTDGKEAFVDGIDNGHDAQAVAKLLRAGKPIVK